MVASATILIMVWVARGVTLVTVGDLITVMGDGDTQVTIQVMDTYPEATMGAIGIAKGNQMCLLEEIAHLEAIEIMWVCPTEMVL